MAKQSPQFLPPQSLDCGGVRIDLAKPQVMGILNVTPDSFSDGGSYFTHDRPDLAKALRRAERMVEEGAAIIDIGGESTRPGAAQVSEQQELDRVIPVIEAITDTLEAAVSIDTSTPRVMLEATAAGAGIINDVRALTRSGALQAAAQTRLPVCLMHMLDEPGTMQNAPSYQDVVGEIYSYLEERIATCVAAGIARDKILVDPGIGFGKSLQHNLKLMHDLESFGGLGVPLLIGVSRKTMIGQILDKPTDQRLYGSLAAAVLAVVKGAKIIRCHDVAATVDALRVADAIINEKDYQV